MHQLYWGKWRSDTFIRSFGHICDEDLSARNLPIEDKERIPPPPPLINFHAITSAPLLLSSQRHLGIISTCSYSFWNVLSGLHASGIMCNILVDTCIHHSEISADCRFATVFLSPNNPAERCGVLGIWLFLFHCSESFLSVVPALSLLCAGIVPSHLTLLLHFTAFQLQFQSTWAMPNMK